MDFDDENSAQKPQAQPRDLGRLGVAEIKDYIAGLEEEIARARDMIVAKQAHGAKASGVFRS